MTLNLAGSPSVPADIGQITPELINPYLLLDIMDLIEPIISTSFPQKRSGFSYTAYILFVCCIQLLQLSPYHTANHIQDQCLSIIYPFNLVKRTNFRMEKVEGIFQTNHLYPDA